MSAQVDLAVDLMSGDRGLSVSLPASLQALRNDPCLRLRLVGDEHAINNAIGSDLPAQASIVHAPDIVPMDARPAVVLRQANDSSMRRALELLAAGQVQGVVSAGNTGALMALARQRVTMLSGFSRPAFCSALPLPFGICYLLDLGANVDCSASQLHEFAAMGSALVSALHGVDSPRVALLSNGKEAAKGNEQIQQARVLLEADQDLNFVGFVEGDDLFANLAEVIVCDGLLGNVALKSMEGTARLLASRLNASYARSPWRRLLAMLCTGVLRELRNEMNPELHNGAFLLGLQGVVVKSHGASSVDSFSAALQQAADCVKHAMVQHMARHLGDQ